MSKATQKIWLLSTDADMGADIEFPVIAGSTEEALQVFRDHLIPEILSEESIPSASELGTGYEVKMTRLFDTGQSAEALPSRIIPWEETSITRHALLQPAQDGAAPDPVAEIEP